MTNLPRVLFLVAVLKVYNALAALNVRWLPVFFKDQCFVCSFCCADQVPISALSENLIGTSSNQGRLIYK